MSAGQSPGTILPPTGEPFAIVGTEEARTTIEDFRQAATDLADLDDADPEKARGIAIDAAVILDVVAHRDHLAAQVTELQQSGTRLVERARLAEADALHLAVLLDEFQDDDSVFLDPITHALVERLLKAAGKPVKSTLTPDDHELGESASPAHVPETCVTCHEFPAEFGNICQACDCDEHGEADDAERARAKMRADRLQKSHETRALTGDRPVGSGVLDLYPVELTTEEATALGRALMSGGENNQETTGPLWAYVIADGTGVMLLEHAPELSNHLDAKKGDDVQEHLTPPGDGLWFWEGEAHWSPVGCEVDEGHELDLEGTWTNASVQQAITTEGPEPSEVTPLNCRAVEPVSCVDSTAQDAGRDACEDRATWPRCEGCRAPIDPESAGYAWNEDDGCYTCAACCAKLAAEPALPPAPPSVVVEALPERAGTETPMRYNDLVAQEREETYCQDCDGEGIHTGIDGCDGAGCDECEDGACPVCEGSTVNPDAESADIPPAPPAMEESRGGIIDAALRASLSTGPKDWVQMNEAVDGTLAAKGRGAARGMELYDVIALIGATWDDAGKLCSLPTPTRSPS